TDEKIVVVIAAQQHPVRERRHVRRRVLVAPPDETSIRRNREPAGVPARRHSCRMSKRPHRDRNRIDQHGFRRVLNLRSKFGRNRGGVACNQRGYFVHYLPLKGGGRREAPGGGHGHVQISRPPPDSSASHAKQGCRPPPFRGR